MNEGAAICFFTAVIFVSLIVVSALLGRQKMKVGELTATVMDMQLHSHGEKEIDTKHCYGSDSFHNYEGSSVLLIMRACKA